MTPNLLDADLLTLDLETPNLLALVTDSTALLIPNQLIGDPLTPYILITALLTRVLFSNNPLTY